jgi:hypothetical protein
MKIDEGRKPRHDAERRAMTIGRAKRRVFLALALLAAAGCRHAPYSAPLLEVPPPTAISSARFPQVQRTSLEPNPAAIPATTNFGKHEIPTAFRELTEGECLALSVSASELGNLLDAENRSLESSTFGGHGHHRRGGEDDDRATRMLQTVRYHLALEARNQAGGLGLDLFYRLAEAEAGDDLLRASLDEVESSLAKVREARERGIRLPVEVETLERQRID